MPVDISILFTLAIILVAAPFLILFTRPHVIAIGARQRLAAGWTLQQIRIMSYVSGLVLLTFCITVPPFGSTNVLLAVLVIAFVGAYWVRGRSAMWQLLKLVAAAAVPFLLVKLFVALNFPDIG